MTDPKFTEFEQGERQALLQLRTFITKHGVKEVDQYAAQRLHDIRQDALHRQRSKPVDLGHSIAMNPPR